MTAADIIILCVAVLSVLAGALLPRLNRSRNGSRHCDCCPGCSGSKTKCGVKDNIHRCTGK